MRDPFASYRRAPQRPRPPRPPLCFSHTRLALSRCVPHSQWRAPPALSAPAFPPAAGLRHQEVGLGGWKRQSLCSHCKRLIKEQPSRSGFWKSAGKTSLEQLIALPMISMIQPHFKSLGAELLRIIELKLVCIRNQWFPQRSNQRNTM